MYKNKTHVKLREQGRSSRRGAGQIVADILSEVFKDTAGQVTVAIGGPGGAGKSTFTKRLAKLLGTQAAILKLDDYKTSRRVRQRARIYGPHPDANKMKLIARHLDAIKNNREFRKPVYDAVRGNAASTESYRPARFNLVDGEVSTYREFRRYVDFTIFIDSDWHTQLASRLGRDITQRRYTPEKAVATFLNSNLREFGAYGSESKQWADVHLFCHDDYRLEIESVATELYCHLKSILHGSLENMEISGLIVPLLTPFDEKGAVDLQAFASHLDWLSSAGVRRVLVGGTTGEFFSLTVHERLDLLKLALEYFPWLVMFNASGSSLAETVKLAHMAEKTGADGILCLPPYYYAHAPEQGLRDYFNVLSDAVRIPLVIYNLPLHTQNPVTTGLLRAVRHFGVKDSAGDLALIPATSRYLTGLDADIIRAYKAGAKGFISGLANVIPELYMAMEKALESGCYTEAVAFHKTIGRVQRTLRGTHEIPLIKLLLAGRCSWYPINVRPPLSVVRNGCASSDLVQEILQRL